MGMLLRDLRYGLRRLARAPEVTAVVVLTLALGIGANTAVFSVVNSVLLRPLPFPEPERIVQVFTTLPREQVWNAGTSYPNYQDFRAGARSLAAMAGWRTASFTLAGGGEPEVLASAAVTPSLFDVLPTRPLVGRVLLPAEEKAGAGLVAVIGESLWRRRFGADPGIVGRVVELDRRPVTVVGVLPAAFQFPVQNPPVELWVPLGQDANFQSLLERRSGHYLNVVARLAPGTSLTGAQAELATLAKGLARQDPEGWEGWGMRVARLDRELAGDTRGELLLLLGAVAFILLIACANVAHLLLARAAARQGEVAVRLTLGAGRSQLARQVLTESVLLAALGGGLGLVAAWLGVPGILALLPEGMPRLHTVTVDLPVLLFTAFLSLATGLVFGLAPAYGSARPRLQAAIAAESRGTGDRRGRRLRRLLIAAQVAVAAVLLTASGLLLRTLAGLERVDPGFSPGRLITAQLALPREQYGTPDAWLLFYRTLIERLRQAPGVTGVSAALPLPLSHAGLNFGFRLEGAADTPALQNANADYNAVDADYFRLLRIPVLYGRAFTAGDSERAPKVCIINQAMARRYFAGQNPLGRRLVFGYGEQVPREIVGVVGDVKRHGVGLEAAPQMYLPHAQDPWWSLAIVLETQTGPAGVRALLREQVHALDKGLPVPDPEPLSALLAESVAEPRLRSRLFGLFGALALGLAAAGIYAMISYDVSRRTREIGIRRALGARLTDLYRMVISDGLGAVALGLGAGLLAAFGLTRLLTGFLFGVTPTDPASYLGSAALLLAVALFAAWWPAHRAARVEPTVALRHE